jgi:hypothetical protein
LVEIWRVHPAALDERVAWLEAEGLHPEVPHVPRSWMARLTSTATVSIYCPEGEEGQARTAIASWEAQASTRAEALVGKIVPSFVAATLLGTTIGCLAAALGSQTGTSIVLGFWSWFLVLVVIGVRQRRRGA